MVVWFWDDNSVYTFTDPTAAYFKLLIDTSDPAVRRFPLCAIGRAPTLSPLHSTFGCTCTCAHAPHLARVEWQVLRQHSQCWRGWLGPCGGSCRINGRSAFCAMPVLSGVGWRTVLAPRVRLHISADRLQTRCGLLQQSKRTPSSPFCVGDDVEAVWQRSTEWYSGRVSSADHTAPFVFQAL